MSATDTCYFLRQYRLKRQLRLEAEKRKAEQEEGIESVLEALCGPMGRVIDVR